MKIKDTISELFKFNRCLLGEGYDNAMEYINQLVGVEVTSVPSGTELGTWTVPDEWVIRDGWIKFNGKKIVDYKKNPLSVVVGSMPIHKKVKRAELLNHLYYNEERPDDYKYEYKFYDKDWGFTMPYNKVKDEEGKVILKEGEYEVFVDAEYKPGNLKYGVHTIPGKTDREILLFAHLDHPYQANDNLSAVACLLDLIKDAKKANFDHTIKLVFCPETIGSQAYGYTEDLSKVDFVVAVDICGNDNPLLFQKSFDADHILNKITHSAFHTLARQYRKGQFRNLIGSDEYFFNDPNVGIPGIMLSRHPYPEYHTDKDTPDIIDEKMVHETGEAILKMIEVYENDFIPKRLAKGSLMRSRYGYQTLSPQTNLTLDYFYYSIDGKKTLAELCCDYGLSFDHMKELLEKIEKDGKLERVNNS